MTYETELSDAEWDLLKKDFEPASKLPQFDRLAFR